MKKLTVSIFMTCSLLVCFSSNSFAQTTKKAKTTVATNTTAVIPTVAQNSSEDYFVGTWKVKAMGLPDGDKELTLQFEKKDGKLTGGIVDAATKKVNPFTSVEVAGDKVTASFMNPEPAMEV